MRPVHITLLALLALLALISNISVAAELPVTLQSGDSRVALGSHLEYIEDPNGTLTIEAVHALADSEFQRIEEDSPNFGFTSSKYWFRTQILNTVESKPRRILEIRYPPLDWVGAYLIDSSGKILLEQTGGDARPFAERPIKSRHFTVDLPLPANEVRWLYLSAQTQGSMQLPAVLLDFSRFVADVRDEQYVLGLYYGILLALVLYNLLTWISIRDSSYLYYLLYIGGFAIFQLTLNGLAFEYLWPDLPAWNNRALPIVIFLSLAALVLLTRAFLRTRTRLPRLDAVQRSVLALLALGSVVVIFMPYHTAIQAATGSAILVPLLIFGAAIYSLALGHREARFFLLAFSILLLGVALYALKTFHLLPRNLITEYSLQIGSALQMILLSFALADRVRILRNQALSADRKARVLLEERVAERTLELDSALAELESKNRILEELNTIDGLTGVRNRTYMDQALAREWPRAYRQQTPISVMLLDIDHFKRVNDDIGHQAGDDALKQVACLIQEHVKRPGDVLCRYGGEEFLVILPDTLPGGAGRLAETVRQAVAKTPLEHNGQNLHLTISIGIAGAIPQSADSDGMQALVKAADSALYRAKNQGRNQVVISEPISSI